MPGDFSQVLSKFRWADHQLAALHIAVSDYIDLKPYIAVVKDKPDAQAYQVAAHLRYPPPASIAHIAGDVLNSLHGTLDYLAWQLALREEGLPDLRTAFPIIKPPKKGAPEPAVNIYRSGKGGRGTVPLISDPAVLRLLRDVQPFRFRQAELNPLLVLRKLNGDSKHRQPAIITAAIDQGHYVYTTQAQALRHGRDPEAHTAVFTLNPTPLKDGDEIAFVPYAHAPKDGLPEHDNFTTVITLEEALIDPRTGQPLPITQGLEHLAGFIEVEVLRPFAKLF
jgi:hypothetical protein